MIPQLTPPLLRALLGEAGLGIWKITISLIVPVATVNSGLLIRLVAAIGRASTQVSKTSLQRLVPTAALMSSLTTGVALIVTMPATLGIDSTGLLRLDAIPSGFRGSIKFDTTKPEETLRQLLDVGRIRALGWTARTPLREGLGEAYHEFRRDPANSHDATK